jgi:hypothetical protein
VATDDPSGGAVASRPACGAAIGMSSDTRSIAGAAEEAVGAEPAASSDAHATSGDAPPPAFWLLALLVASLRLAPYLRSLSLDPAPGFAVLQFGYLPKDTAAYVAFVRQAASSQSLFLFDPFTTDGQQPRFLLLFHSLLGLVCRATGASPTLVLELSRFPLVLLFLRVLWSFLRPIFPAARARLLACVIVGLSGGLAFLVRPLAAWLPPPLAEQLLGSTVGVFGWSTFDTLYNPLWIAALTLALILLRPILSPEGPRGARDVALLGVGEALLAWTHVYTAIAVAGVAAAVPLIEWLLARRVALRRHGLVWLGLGPAGLAVALVGRWQAQDPVYRAVSANALGPNDLSVFWAPLTLGAVLVLAARGAQRWVADAHPYRDALLAWIVAIVWLHTSPLLNGYHFVPYLHLPLAILATVGALEAIERMRRATGGKRLAALALVAALFPASLAATASALRDVGREDAFPEAQAEVIEDLASRPGGNVLAPADLGNLIPAFTPHRVWVGQWFLTPDALARARRFEALVSQPSAGGELARLIDEQRIDYLIVPRARAAAVAAELGGRVGERKAHGALELLALRPPEAP